jgi:hypothetical protein
MAQLSKKDLLKRYRLRVEISQRWRKKEGYDKLWKELIDLYRGRQFETSSEHDQIAVNIAKATVDIIATSVSVNDPKLTITPRQEEKAPYAVIAERVMDYWFTAEHMNVGPEIRLAVNDWIMIGHGWVKTGWRYAEHERPLAPHEMDAAFADQATQADLYAQQNPELAPQLPTDTEIYQSLPTSTTEVDVDQPFAERVSPFDVFVDPEGTSVRNIRWIAQKIKMPVEDAKANENWSASARKHLNGELGYPDAWFDKDNPKDKSDPDCQRVTIWEFYDLHNHTMCVFSEGGEDFLLDPQPMPYAFGNPFQMVRNYDIPEYFYPMGDLEAIEPLQKELNKTRTQLMRARAQFIRKTFYREEALGTKGRKALESKEEEWVPVAPGQWQLSDIAAPAPVYAPAPELFNYSSEIIQNVDLVTATSEYDRGGAAQEIRRTATEAAAIQDRTNGRSADKLARIEKFIGAVGGNMLCLARQFMTTEQVVTVAGRDAQMLWVPYDGSTFDFDADVQVEGGSTRPKNEMWRMSQAQNMLQSMMPFVQAGIVDPHEVARFALEGFGVQNPDKFLVDPNQGPPAVDPQTGQPVDPQDPNAVTPTGAPGQDPAQPPPPPGGDPNAQDPSGGIPPQLLAQLAGQVGYSSP